MSELHLGPFALHDKLGRGGWGEVYRGLHRDQGVNVAIKVLHREGQSDERKIAAFRNEVRAVARLNHPGIVWILDYGEIDPEAQRRSGGQLQAGSPYLVMELASGGSLDQVQRLPSWPELRTILVSLLDARLLLFRF